MIINRPLNLEEYIAFIQHNKRLTLKIGLENPYGRVRDVVEFDFETTMYESC